MIHWFQTASGTELVLLGFLLGVIIASPALFQLGWQIGRWCLARSLMSPLKIADDDSTLGDMPRIDPNWRSQ